jgi:hypothetical protein
LKGGKMKRKTKVASYMLIIGLIMFITGILYSMFVLKNPFSETGIKIMSILIVPGGVIAGISFQILRNTLLIRYIHEE